jgi:hypothetical protein
MLDPLSLFGDADTKSQRKGAKDAKVAKENKMLKVRDPIFVLDDIGVFFGWLVIPTLNLNAKAQRSQRKSKC